MNKLVDRMMGDGDGGRDADEDPIETIVLKSDRGPKDFVCAPFLSSMHDVWERHDISMVVSPSAPNHGKDAFDAAIRRIVKHLDRAFTSGKIVVKEGQSIAEAATDYLNRTLNKSKDGMTLRTYICIPATEIVCAESPIKARKTSSGKGIKKLSFFFIDRHGLKAKEFTCFCPELIANGFEKDCSHSAICGKFEAVTIQRMRAYQDMKRKAGRAQRKEKADPDKIYYCSFKDNGCKKTWKRNGYQAKHQADCRFKPRRRSLNDHASAPQTAHRIPSERAPQPARVRRDGSRLHQHLSGQRFQIQPNLGHQMAPQQHGLPHQFGQLQPIPLQHMYAPQSLPLAMQRTDANRPFMFGQQHASASSNVAQRRPPQQRRPLQQRLPLQQLNMQRQQARTFLSQRRRNFNMNDYDYSRSRSRHGSRPSDIGLNLPVL